VSFNRAITPHRRVAFASLPFATIHAIKTAMGVSVHDVVLATCAGGVRTWLLERGELPGDPLLAEVPILVRSSGRDGGQSDHIAGMIAILATTEADPRRRLERTATSTREARSRNALPANLIQDMTRFAPPAVAGLAGRMVSAIPIDDVASPPFNLIVSNLPGPRHPVYCAGARQVASYPLSLVRNGVGLHVSFASYDDHIHLGLVACREALPALWELADAMAAELDVLAAAVV
jgi:WS/DGAT/MGAT family acyltransferase